MPDLHELPSLTQIVIQFTNINYIPSSALNGLLQLKELRLDNNKLTAVPPDLILQPTLTRLAWHNNPLVSVATAPFSSLTLLGYLSLGGTNLTVIPDLSDLVALYEFDMSNTGLTYLRRYV